VTLRDTHRTGDGRTHQMALWEHFTQHHYMSSDLMCAFRSRVARLPDGTPAAFVASLPAPGVKECGLSHDLSRIAWRESRLVVRPEFQVDRPSRPSAMPPPPHYS
jgi:hypothetical protein